MDFVLGGTAAMGACFFSNPMEVLKTRLQLQGYVVAKNDGILALQKGLVPALWVQLIMNGVRLGVYGFADSAGYLKDKQGNIMFTKTLLITGAGSATGQFVSSPFFLVKTHLQAQAVAAIAVGHQHNHEGSLKALTNIYKANGIRGLFRGSTATIPRAFIGGSSQLIGFDYAKQFINHHNITNIPILKSFLSSMVAGILISVVMTPFDLISTRLYNQPTNASGQGLLYKSYFDCLHQIYKSEGLLAFYKGIGPMYLRLGPHTVLCLVFFDELRTIYNRYFIQENIRTNI